jgi:hypothetical protein
MAVENEIADVISAEVDAERDTGERVAGVLILAEAARSGCAVIVNAISMGGSYA